MNQSHERFQEWLAAGADGEPPRDLAVHASVCAICQRAIVAFDRLAAIDPGRASMPVSAVSPGSPRSVPATAAASAMVPPRPSVLAKLSAAKVTPAAAAVVTPATPPKPPKPARPTAREREVITRKGLTRVGRLAGAAAGVMFSAVVLGFGASQLIAITRSGGLVGQAGPTPGQSELFTTTAEPTTSATPVPTPVPTPIPTPVPTPPPQAGAPGPPRSLTAVVSIGQIALSWSAPSSDGGSPITKYNIYKDGSGSPFNSVTTRNYTDTVGNVATHVYRVTAVNKVGSGPYSNAASSTTPNVPGAPVNLVATGGPNQITLTWAAPASNGSNITRYDILRDGLGTPIGSVATPGYTDARLGYGEAHSYVVKAVNAVGSSAGASASATTDPPPSSSPSPTPTPTQSPSSTDPPSPSQSPSPSAS